jgi:hypothetical protein
MDRWLPGSVRLVSALQPPYQIEEEGLEGRARRVLCGGVRGEPTGLDPGSFPCREPEVRTARARSSCSATRR